MSFVNKKLAILLIVVGYIILCSSILYFFIMGYSSVKDGNILAFIINTILSFLIGILSIATGDIIIAIDKLKRR